MARQRIAAGIKDVETEKMLGEICRSDPEDLEFRMARADLLFDLDQKESALEIYLQILTRSRSGTSPGLKSRVGLKPEQRSGILDRAAQVLLGRETWQTEEIDIFLEATLDPQATPELLHSMGSTWPREGFTIDENLADLERHQQEFLERQAFAYTVVSLDEARVLGCVYINPPKDEGYDAFAYMWVRQSEYDQGLDPILFKTVKAWLETSWPFSAVYYHGRQ